MSDDDIFDCRQTVKHACMALRRYFDAHVAIKANDLRRALTRSRGGSPPTPIPAYKVTRTRYFSLVCFAHLWDILSKLKINFMFPQFHVLFIKNVDRQTVPVHYSLLLLSQFHHNIILFTYNLSKFILWCVRPPAFPRPPGCFLCFPEESKTLNFEVWMSKHNTDKKPEMHFSLLQLSFSSLKKNLSGQSQISNVFLWQISIILCNHTVLTKIT